MSEILFNPPPVAPLSVYVHIPWCVRKCPYCDFNSHAQREEIPEARYLDALTRDLEGALPDVWGREVSSVFIGGGTPSLFTPAGIDRLLTTLRTLLRVSPLAEITLEANPGTFEVARFRGYRDAGVNRLSLGIQSFNPEHLKALGRIHDQREAWAAAESAITLFESVNLDLMYALPEQNLEQARADLETALSLGPAHLSAYHLTLEPNTPFAAHPPALPEDDLAADMQIQAEALLGAAGYEHYETSAFARPGARCRHNLNYWTFGDYLGLGAGAHGKLSFHDRIERQARLKHPKAYMDAVFATSLGSPAGHVSEKRELGRDDRVFEFMMNALRLNEGFDPRLFETRTGLSIAAAEAGLADAERRNLLLRTLHNVRPSATGRRFLNELLQVFL
ncbi:MAG: radical SAM family heme chaperone HemW [Pseudomonadota bacterium]|nr:radical SAM family heme chaperone HemW [Pseudomonadota bacterium]MDP1905932.1 radical SAM family heme chaperone HemW [Pseudomonadota bacterium]MDP2353610.1 radical SAM family heme chaperone HemW [Pseudomonadota bacterium]